MIKYILYLNSAELQKKGSSIFTIRYWWVIITYIIMQFSAPILIILFSIDNIHTKIYIFFSSFILYFIIVLILIKTVMQSNLKNSITKKSDIILCFIRDISMAYFPQSFTTITELFQFG